MNGAESIVRTLLASDVTTCFANPGTSEMHFVAALDRIPGMRCVLGLFEGVVTGAADGYGRMTGQPAVTLLHCGPGFANGIANLHNARRARTPIVNIVGDHATHHRELDPPLAADAEGWARGVSAWTRTSNTAELVGADVAAAVQAARTSPGQIATLIAPADTCWNEGGVVAAPLPAPGKAHVPAHQIAETARLLRRGGSTLIMLSGTGLTESALADAHRIAAATGAKLMAHQFNGRVPRGQGRYPIPRLAYGVTQAIETLAEFDTIVLAGAAPQVAPFAYPGKPGYLYRPDATVHVFARPELDIPVALARLADELSAPKVPGVSAPRPEGPVGGRITQDAVTRTLAALLPENAVVVDESVSFGRLFFGGLAGAAPHDWLQITGGAIGSGLPMATGAAIGAPGRRIVSLQADGSAMFTVQALWTQARERLPITTVILSNRRYEILLGELTNVGANPGRVALDMLSLGDPDIGWVRIAQGLGVEAARAEDMKTFADLFSSANAKSGPFVIELVI